MLDKHPCPDNQFKKKKERKMEEGVEERRKEGKGREKETKKEGGREGGRERKNWLNYSELGAARLCAKLIQRRLLLLLFSSPAIEAHFHSG